MNDARPSASVPVRVPAFDGLRGVALLMVFCIHCLVLTHTGWITGALHRLVSSFWISIDIFFVLSGYLITRILLSASERQHYYRNFYIRRVARTLPAYYFVLIYAVYVVPAIGDMPWPPAQQALIPWFFLQIQNWALVLHPQDFPWSYHGVSHLWSMGVEEQFYLVWPFVIALVPRKRLFAVCVGVLLFSMMTRFILVAHDVAWTLFYVMPFSHLDGFAAGGALAFLIAENKFDRAENRKRIIILERVGWLVLAVLFLFCGGMALGGNSWVMALAITAATFATVGVVYRIHFSLLPTWARWVLEHPACVWLGTYSYGIYLIHFVFRAQVIVLLLPKLPPFIASSTNLTMLAASLVIIPASIVFGRLLYYFVESPAMRLGSRIAQRASRPPQAIAEKA